MNLLKKLFQKQKPIKTSLSISSSNGFHLRPIAKFVNEVKKFETSVSIEAKGKTLTATQVPNILSLSLEKNESFTLICTGKDAQEASEHLSSFFIDLMTDEKEITVIKQKKEHYEGKAFVGQTVGKGIGIAPLVKAQWSETTQENFVRIRTAIEESEKELEALYLQNGNNSDKEIFLAQKALLDSDVFKQHNENIKTLKENINNEIENLKEGKYASRIDDYRDLEQRILSHLGIKTELHLPSYPFILLAEKLLPSDIALLTQSSVKGVVLQTGNTTSHIAILLRSAGIPSLIIQEPLSASKTVILDANSGQLISNPSKADFKKAEELKADFFKAQDQSFDTRHDIAKTLTGQAINVLANITNTKTAKEAKEQGADGIGLFRTEFLFTENKPTIQEQTHAYQEVFELFDEVTIRTLDIGGDKSLPYIDIPKEDNPFLGLRGIRFSLQEQSLFKEQLLAIFQAVGSISSNVKPLKTIKIMFPMISTTQEFIEAKTIAQKVAKENNLDISKLQFGIMLEVPSVIFALKAFDKLVDFYSIGSNDLTQYLFAIERTHPSLSVDPTSPMLFEALKQIINTTNKPLSICGELAGLEVATEALIDMGYETLSVSAKLIPNLKEHIRQL